VRLHRLIQHPLFPAVTMALLCSVGLGSWLRVQGAAQHVAQTQQVQPALATTRLRLQATLESTFAVTGAAEALVVAQTTLDPAALERLMTAHGARAPALRKLMVAPGGVVRWAHPAKQHEDQLGLDYRSKAASQIAIEQARTLRTPVLTAPAMPSSGGAGLVQWRPVFVPDAQGAGRFWGVVTAGADLATVATQAGLDSATLDLVLVHRLADGKLGDTVWGAPSLRDEPLLREELGESHAPWLLMARPKGGWVPWAWWAEPTWWLGLLGSALCVGLCAALGRRRMALHTSAQALQAEIQHSAASEAAAQAATARFESLVSSASDWLWETDAEHNLHFPNPQYRDSADRYGMHGGKPRWAHPQLLPGPDWDAHRATLRRREAFRNFEYGHIAATGEPRYVSISGAPVLDADGQFLGYRGTGRDVTAVHEAQAALAAANSRLAQASDDLQAVMDSAVAVAIVVVDLDGRVRVFSRGAEQVLGCTVASVLGTPAIHFHWREEVEAVANALTSQLRRPVARHAVFERQAAGLDGGHTRLWTFVRRDTGAHRLVSHTYTQLRNKAGVHTGYVAVAQDVTEQVQMQARLRETNARMQAVLDASVEVAILLGDTEGRALLFNRGAELMTGYSAEQVVGTKPSFLHDPEEMQTRIAELTVELGRPVAPVEVFLHQAAQPPGLRSRMWTYVRPDGTRVPVSVTLSEVRDGQGVLMGFLGVGRDMTEQLAAQRALERLNDSLTQRVEARTRELAQTQAELLRSDRLASLGGMVAGVAHELNTPIGIGLTAASTLEDRCKDLQAELASGGLRRSTLNEFVRDAQSVAELVLRSLGQAADLVTHFKQLSVDQTSEQRRSFLLAQVVDDVLVLLRPQLKASGLMVVLDVPADLSMDSYPGALGRLISNLLLNAKLHAFDPPGSVTQPTLHISAQALAEDQIELTVSDNGHGMPREVQRRAFDPFFSTKLGQGGTGLGLSIVHNAATTLLGGSVQLSSQPGKGTRFTFKLPRSAPQGVNAADLTGFAGLG
jgi:PAS domain S-box-containing protein